MSNPTNNVFKGVGNNLTGAVLDMQLVAPHDTNYFGSVAIGLYITVGGVVVFTTANDQERTVTVPDNFYLVCSCKRVKDDGTTATGIHALVS
jgi:hypothetical protein